MLSIDKMPDYMQEQLMVILTTTLSLLTAWSWNSVLQQYIDQYYGRSLSTRVLSAVLITIITFLLINWLLRHFRLYEKKLARVQRTNLTNYVINGSYPDEEEIIPMA
uniref:Uncharacterized protein n=1 Tax=Marseillevirus LCMAC201 TaxID=2506605 RepID=A0A481YV22_9VIRU|nr:MAG: hypothetical protein LCMAC201_00350 [Marseillevirus LCMAC201]